LDLRLSGIRNRYEVDSWSTSTFFICLLVLSPIMALMIGLFQPAEWWSHLSETLLRGYITQTLWLTLSVTGLSLLMAVPSAWLISHFEFPGRRMFEWAMVLPLAVPTYVAAFVYMDFSEHFFPLLIQIRSTYGVDVYLWAESFMRKGLLALFMAGVLYPYLYLSLKSSFQRQQQEVLEAASLLGRKPSSIFFTIALPLARPALIAGISLIVMEVVNDYGAVHFFGVPTLTVGIFRTWRDFGDLTSSVRLATGLVACILIFLSLEHAQRGRALYTEGSKQSRPMARTRIRSRTVPFVWLACGLPLLIGFLYPVTQLSLWLLDATSDGEFGELVHRILNSLGLSLATAAFLTLAALLIAYTLRLHPNLPLRNLVSVASVGYAIPGAVIAVGIMSCSSLLRLPAFLATGSVGAILIAYAARFLAVPLHPIRASMQRVCGNLDLASRVLGHSPGSTLCRINLPLLRGSLISAMLLVFIDILKELPLTMILRPAQFETLALLAFSRAKEDRLYDTALPSLMIILLATLGLVVMNRLANGRKS